MARRSVASKKQWVSIAVLAVCGVAVCGCPVVRSAPVARALDFLDAQQLTQPLTCSIAGTRVRDFPGDWPQYFYFRDAPAVRIREVSPFMVAYIHEALTTITAQTAPALGLLPADVENARLMRQRAVAFIQTFASPPTAPDAGTYGFWPQDQGLPNTNPILSRLTFLLLRGPVLDGTRTPLNLPIYSRELAIPSDADVTAAAYLTLLNQAALGEGPAVSGSPAHFFSDWRDTGVDPRRFNPPWLPHASGAFLTWLSYHDPPDLTIPNDVDLVVNANVLYTLARFGKLDTPGVTDAIALINLAVSQNLYRTHPDQISLYYPNNFAFQFSVSRAYREGPVPGLKPAVETLADDLEARAIVGTNGIAHWDQGDPDLNTAFAALTLLNAGRDTPLIGMAIKYLKERQDRCLGSWKEGVFFIARTDGGPQVNWTSASFTTAMALEAICRYELNGSTG